MGVYWYRNSHPRMVHYFVYTDPFVRVHLQHSRDKVSCSRIYKVRDAVDAL